MVPSKYIRDEVEKFILNHMMYKSTVNLLTNSTNNTLTKLLITDVVLSIDKPILYNNQNTPIRNNKLTYRLGKSLRFLIL